MEVNWICTNYVSGYVTKDDLPGLDEDECIPYIGVPNMVLPDGRLRTFTVEEIMEALEARNERA
ncbi:hypothetical protein [uncultured Faecalibaculum sp.]|nr:hypothetical protein [uncultured Faecalibaculum sp.]